MDDRDSERACYIAGPMAGLPDSNFPAFRQAESVLEAEGWTVLNPATGVPDKILAKAERLGAAFRDTPDYRALMRRDIEWVMAVDAVFLLPGWEKSRGATCEALVAQMLGRSVNTFEDRMPVPPLQASIVEPLP